MATSPKSGKKATPVTPAVGQTPSLATPKRTQVGVNSEGATGLQAFGGFVYDEFVSKLQGINGARVYREMADNDPVLGAVIFAIEMLLRNVTWRVEAKDASGPAQTAKVLLEGMLFQDMSHTWSEFIAEVLTMLVHGYSVFEIVWKVRAGYNTDATRNSRFSDKLFAPRRLAPRSQLTLWRWDMDPEGEILGVEQLLVEGGVAYIPGPKLLMFRTTSRRNNPEGRSILRNAYVSYLRKKVIEDAEGRAALRSAGVVTLKIPSAYIDPGADLETQKAYAQYKAVATSLAQDRQGSVILPSDRDEHGNSQFELGYTVADSRRPAEMGAIIDRLDGRMVMTCLADFLMLGAKGASGGSGGGSFSLSADKTDMFEEALGAFLTIICDSLNRVLVPKIWAVNALDPAVQPTVGHSDLNAPDIGAIGSFIQSLANAGAPMFPNSKLENALLELAGLPAEQEHVEDEAVSIVGPNAAPDPADPATDPAVNPGQRPSAPPGQKPGAKAAPRRRTPVGQTQ